MILFHGTNADAAKRILTEGFRTHACGAVWTCSGEEIYFWSPTALVECGEADAEGDAEYFARSRAFENAQCALPGARDCRTVVFEVEVADANSVLPDESCENMCGAVCVGQDVPTSAIRRVWISDDLSLLKGYFLAMMNGRDLSNLELSAIEQRIVKAMESVEIYPEDVEELAQQTVFSVEAARDLLR